ncbi:MAG: hypothetical protein AAB710_02540 [Patescibacteria group bacterium]
MKWSLRIFDVATVLGLIGVGFIVFTILYAILVSQNPLWGPLVVVIGFTVMGMSATLAVLSLFLMNRLP